MYHVSAQGVDERMINVHYYYYKPKFPMKIFDLLCSRSRSQRTEFQLFAWAICSEAFNRLSPNLVW